MTVFQINDDERDALRGLPSISREMYVFGIRPFMDYATGIVGIKRGISWKSIAEELYVEPHQGIDSGEPTEKQLRRALVWLQKVGLLSQNKAERRLVFELLKASRDQSVRNKVGSKWADEAGRQAAPLKPTESVAYSEEEGRQVAGGQTHKVGTPPVSGKTNTQHNACVREIDTRTRFAMTDGWEPSPVTFQAVLHRNGMSNQPLNPDHLLEFRSYWIAQPDKHNTQAQWEHKFAQQLKRNHQIQSERPGHETGRANAGKRTRNAIDVLTNDNW